MFDSGEQHAVALARAMGIEALLSDDTKEYGPHETLVKELIEDVMPFAFYELLFLKYISTDMEIEKLHNEFEAVNKASFTVYPMNFRKKMMTVVRRFSRQGAERDREWLSKFCDLGNEEVKRKFKVLSNYLKSL